MSILPPNFQWKNNRLQKIQYCALYNELRNISNSNTNNNNNDNNNNNNNNNCSDCATREWVSTYYAPLTNPIFLGKEASVFTQPYNDSTNHIASCAFVMAQIAGSGTGGDVYTGYTNTYTNSSVNFFDASQLCTKTLQIFDSKDFFSIPQGKLGETVYNGITCVNSSFYFYPSSASPYNPSSWNAIALQSNYTYINPTLEGTSQIGNNFTLDTIHFKNKNFYTDDITRTTIINTDISSSYTGEQNVIIGNSYNLSSTILTSGVDNTIVGAYTNFLNNSSNNCIFGYNNSISVNQSGCFGISNAINHTNTILIGSNSSTTNENLIELGSSTQTTRLANGYLQFTPTTTFTNGISQPKSTIATSRDNNNIYAYDSLYWTRLTQKNCPFGWNNTEGFQVAKMEITIIPTGLPTPNSLVTFHMNYSFVLTDKSTTPYETTSIMISGAMITFDLYAIMVEENTNQFNSNQASNLPGPTDQYCNGYADLGMIKINQPAGTKDWIKDYNPYPLLVATNMSYISNTLILTFELQPADPITKTFPSTIISGCNAVCELKNDMFIPSPYKINFNGSGVPYLQA